MTLTLLTLFVAPSLIALIYAMLEHTGYLDQVTGRKDAVDALARLKSAAGFPVSFLYDDDQDSRLFTALEKRISKNVPVVAKNGDVIKQARPSCITVAGQPVPLNGVPNEWPQECRFAYLSEHSVMYLFGVARTGNQKAGKALRVCTLGQIEKWLTEEKDARKHWVGAVAIGLISVAFVFLRYSVAS